MKNLIENLPASALHSTLINVQALFQNLQNSDLWVLVSRSPETEGMTLTCGSDGLTLESRLTPEVFTRKYALAHQTDARYFDLDTELVQVAEWYLRAMNAIQARIDGLEAGFPDLDREVVIIMDTLAGRIEKLEERQSDEVVWDGDVSCKTRAYYRITEKIEKAEEVAEKIDRLFHEYSTPGRKTEDLKNRLLEAIEEAKNL